MQYTVVRFAGRLRHIAQRVCCAAVIAICMVPLVAAPAAALAYGEGVYGDCAYSAASCAKTGSASSASSASSPTVAQTGTGLDVAINLQDGQIITEDEYQITITPLNGQGSSFQKAELYLDGALAFSGQPDTDGTWRWTWNVKGQPATTVRILIYDTNGQVITKTFAVKIQLAGSPATTSTAAGPHANSSVEVLPATTNDMAALAWAMVVSGLVLVVIVVFWLRHRHHRQDGMVQFYR